MKKKKHGEEYISCLASNFKQPIAVLVDRLLAVQLPDFHDDPPRTPEVDYATSLVVLLVLQFEAWISRVRYFDKIVVPTFVGRREAAAVFKTVKDALQILDELGYVKVVPKVPHVRFGGKLSFPFWSMISVIQRSLLVQKNNVTRERS